METPRLSMQMKIELGASMKFCWPLETRKQEVLNICRIETNVVACRKSVFHCRVSRYEENELDYLDTEQVLSPFPSVEQVKQSECFRRGVGCVAPCTKMQ